MSLRSMGYAVLIGLLLIVAVSSVAGSILGQPILLIYVETGSMEPTLEPGDGLVVIPIELMGPIDTGDVVVFEAKTIQDGGLTTHRVVGETERGYITRGDANPFTDQDADEPPVKREQIVAEPLQVGGSVVVIPHLGTAAQAIQGALQFVQTQIASVLGTRAFLGTQGLAYFFFVGTILYYLVGEYRDRRDQQTDRSNRRDIGTDPHLVLGVFAVVLVFGATATMAVPAGPQQFGIVSSEFNSERPDVIPIGESKDRTYHVPNSGLVPTVVFLEPGSDQVEIAPQEHYLGPRETVNATLTLHAPPEIGYYRYYVTEHRYLALLPTSTIRTLYGMHPWLPVVVIDALIAGAFLGLTLPFVGSGRIRDRSRDGASRSLLTRLVR
jgi:signal peptidase